MCSIDTTTTTEISCTVKSKVIHSQFMAIKVCDMGGGGLFSGISSIYVGPMLTFSLYNNSVYMYRSYLLYHTSGLNHAKQVQTCVYDSMCTNKERVSCGRPTDVYCVRLFTAM